MPVTPTYPGVYIEEVPSGVRTIVGVATSITAFFGRAERGPVDDPVTINSFGDFERSFGGLGVDYPMSYAVRDFYRNGGSQAIIVRLFSPKNSDPGVATATVDSLDLEASSPGTWANRLEVEKDAEGITDEVAERYGLSKEDLFNLTVTEKEADDSVKTQEVHRNLSVNEGPRQIERVLKQESSLVRLQEDDGNGGNDDGNGGNGGGNDDGNGGNGDGNGGNGGNGDGNGGNGGNGGGNGGNGDDTSVSFAGGADGQALQQADYQGKEDDKTGLWALEKADLFNLLCIPADTRSGDTPAAVYQDALAYCTKRRAMLLVDPPQAWGQKKETAASEAKKGLSTLSLTGKSARNGALYFPRVVESDPLREGQPDTFVPCGIIAGLMSRTDTQRGVWKAPAGIDASLNGIRGLQANLTDAENGMLNPLGINCLRSFPVIGPVAWGARTLRGADQLADEYKYVPVRRLALFLEESLFRGTKWVVFEPNDEPLWSQIRLNIGAFMHDLFRKGAFQGSTPKDAYRVKCDSETTTQNDINLGIVNIVVGFAPLKPAEFVIIKIQQIAGEIET